MLRRVLLISLGLMGLGAIVLAVAAGADFAPFVGGGLFLIGLIGAFASVTTSILVGMRPQEKKDKR